ncbi:cellulose synthase-like protein E6 [Chenopodium quinoa]|uniref:cellulose synthase-like protein E6 n=1 Tax=Chenopodium quinoa TaxID=63459 RepID=UPI000B77ED9E|nr:cellulose synthase-like protein E6 [Chenopodium quinoa]
MEKSKLHDWHVHKVSAFLNRSYAFLHIVATAPIFYLRVAYLYDHTNKNRDLYNVVPLLPWLLIFAAEILFFFSWIFKQSYYWCPLSRTALPENLPVDEQLPKIDVFVCTVDPVKEPTLDVMNTVISAMSLDYPAHKLSVYVSDDGGASVTLDAMKHAWVFATWWLPFCKRYNVLPISPKAFFQQHFQPQSQNTRFIQDFKLLKEKYEEFEERVCSWKERPGDVNDNKAKGSAKDHSPIIQVINESFVGDDDNVATTNPENINKMPFLVYVAREKRPSHHHHFKSGALNVLQRVSSILSNAPYILVLDCDMYCNDSNSARQAMCFYLDPKINQSIAWVQFPQKFHNVNEKDVYDGQMRATWPIIYPGTDGLQGPLLSGTNFYINRKALYAFDISAAGNDDINELRHTFGSSNLLIKSVRQIDEPNHPNKFSSDYLQEAHFLASCVYEEDTLWGEKVGFRYDSVVEDVMTGYILHSKGWKSVYLNPPSPQFLGSATTNLNETIIQHSRWTAGLLQLGLSKYCPLFNTSTRMPILQKLVYSWIVYYPFDFLPNSCFAIIQPLCLFYGIPLYPKVSDPFFIPFAFVFISSHLKPLYEAFLCGGSINSWLNAQRFLVIKNLTSYVYGTLDCVMGKLGLRETIFMLTNKVGDDDTSKWYLNGKYDFRTSNMFLVPIVTAVNLNLSSFVVGVTRAIVTQSWDTLFAQAFFSFYMFIISLPVIEGMLLRKDKARIPLSTTLKSTLLSWFVLSLGYLIVVRR